MPAEARANTDAGAQAFVKYYVFLMNRAVVEPRAGLLSPLSAPSCKSCAQFEKNAQYYVDHKQRYQKNPLTVLEVSKDSDTPETPVTAIFDVVVDQATSKVLDQNNQVVNTLAAKRSILVFSLARGDEGWLVALVQAG